MLSAPSAIGGSLVRIWELDLGKWNGSRPDKFPVEALSFSRDGKQVAFTTVDSLVRGKNGAPRGRLFVASIGANPNGVRVYSTPPGGKPIWSPEGNSVFVGHELIRLDTGNSCRLPNAVGFLSENELVGWARGKPPGLSTQIKTFDQNCQAVAHRDTPETWTVGDVSPERRLLLINHGTAERLLMEVGSGRVVRRWQSGGTGGGFANSGKALCQVADGAVDAVDEGTNVRCWNSDTGELIGYGPANRATIPVVPAARSPRVVFAELGSLPILGLIPGVNPHPYAGAVVWDLMTGERVASWWPEVQTYELPAVPPTRIREASKFCISADGNFVAEGGNGKLTVYRISP